jgi:hypothetical protein
MINENPNEFQPQARLAAFQQKVLGLTDKNRSFAATVREVFPTIEPAIKDGAPLDALLSALNEHYGLNGTLSAFKSALSRIRKETAALRLLGIRLNPDGSIVMPSSVQISNSDPMHRPEDAWSRQQNFGQFQQMPPMPRPRF